MFLIEIGRHIFSIIFDQNLVECMTSTLGYKINKFVCFKNLNISGMKRDILKCQTAFFFSYRLPVYALKLLGQQRYDFLHSTTLINGFGTLLKRLTSPVTKAVLQRCPVVSGDQLSYSGNNRNVCSLPGGQPTF